MNRSWTTTTRTHAWVLAVLLGLSAPALAASGAATDDASLDAMIAEGQAARVVELMASDADTRATERTHYWQARGELAQIEEASVFRKIGLARSARDHLLAALEIDPDSVRVRETLAGYYIQAPAMAGGSLEAAAEQADRLEALDPAASYRVRARMAQAEDDQEAAVSWRRKALAASEWTWEAQYALVITAVHYQLASAPEVLEEASVRVRDSSETPEMQIALLDYQRGKYAAVTGTGLEEGSAALERYLAYEPEEGQPQRVWAEFRLAQVERQLGQERAAQARLVGLESQDIPEDLGYALRDERRWHYD